MEVEDFVLAEVSKVEDLIVDLMQMNNVSAHIGISALIFVCCKMLTPEKPENFKKVLIDMENMHSRRHSEFKEFMKSKGAD